MLWYPLRFHPLFRHYLWGGRRLETFLNKQLGEGPRFAESWEIVDRQDAQSIVANGQWQGKSLAELLQLHRAEVLGKTFSGANLPLLLKFLDCQLDLSVQVHPDDAYGATLNPPDLGKTEAWYVIHADPGSRLYAGLLPGVNREQLAEAIAQGETARCLYAFEPHQGDCVFIPAGTVHALGAGLIVAEIQQASDTTFRLFDWNRLDAQGKSRDLHIAQALDVIDYARGPVSPQIPEKTDVPACERLVTCDKFVLNRWSSALDHLDWQLDTRGTFRILTMIQDHALLTTSDGQTEMLQQGDSVLIPACLGKFQIKPSPAAVLLEAFLP